MYYGESNTSVDDKGRLNLPLHLKTRMNDLNHELWYVTRGYDGALFMFHEERWREVVRTLETLETPSGLHPRLHDLRRFILGSVAVVKSDNHNRFSIPAPLRQYAGIERDAVILGLGDHLELWSARGWTAFQESQAENFKRAAEELFRSPRAGVGLPKEGLES